jgi:hypothetical protein
VDFTWKDHAESLEALPQAPTEAPTTSRVVGVGGASKEMLREAMGITDKPPSS